MQIQKAVQKAGKFTRTDNPDVPGQSCLRFVAGTTFTPPRIMATNGRSGIVIDVDSQVPDAVAFVKDVLPAFKQPVEDYLLEGNVMRVWAGAARVFEVPLWDPAVFPPMPDAPSTTAWAVDWEYALMVAHAAGDKKDKEKFQHLHFRGDRVEATNTARIAVAEAYTGVRGLLPAEMFQKWPVLGNTALGRAGDYLWVLVGDEMRWGRFLDSTFPEVDPYVPDYHADGPTCVIDTKELIEVIRQAVSVSVRKNIEIQGGLECVQVMAFTQDNEDGSPTRGYEASVRALIGLPSRHRQLYPRLVVDGAYLLSALKVIKTPRVRLSYSDDVSPLRIESGPLVEVIWPKVT